MSGNSSYNVSIFTNLDRETERLRTQALRTWSKEARMLGWYGLRDGLSVLELGSGPGFVTEQLLDWLPHSPITTVEIAPEMIERAARYLGDKGAGRLRIVHADLMQSGLPENALDFVISRFLFQHMADPVAVAREVRRLLKPGGKLVMIDVDDGLWGIADPERPEDGEWMAKGIAAQAARGGDRLVGRKFLRILSDAGYAHHEFDVVVYHSDMAGERFREQVREMVNPEDMQLAIANGEVTREEADRIIAEDEKWLTSDHPLLLYTLFMSCGEKPAESR